MPPVNAGSMLQNQEPGSPVPYRRPVDDPGYSWEIHRDSPNSAWHSPSGDTDPQIPPRTGPFRAPWTWPCGIVTGATIGHAGSGKLCDMLLRGRVTGGIGDHAYWMTVHADLYEARTGVFLYPGTLNVVLDHPWHVGSQRVRLEPPEYGVGLSIVPCTLQHLDAFILRTDKNDRGEGDHPPNILEVAAAVRLRDALGLQNGDEVEIIVADQLNG